MVRYLSIILLSILSVAPSKAQSDFDFTQRWFNEALYNPAAVGNSFTTGIFLHGKQQWLGISKAPTIFAGTFDTYINTIRSGIGVTLTTDRAGLISRHNARLAYSYYIKTGYKSTLALGLSGGVLVDSKRIDGALIDDPNDPELAYGNTTEYSPDFDFGAEFKGPFKAGIGIRHIGAKPSKNIYAKHSINIWVYLSSRFNITRAISLEPMLSGTYRDHIYRFEGGALLYFFKTQSRDTYNDRFWLGAVFRTGNTAAVMGGIHVTPKVRIGYSFDYGFGNIMNLSKYGSHEIFLAFQLNRIFYKDPLCPAYQ